MSFLLDVVCPALDGSYRQAVRPRRVGACRVHGTRKMGDEPRRVQTKRTERIEKISFSPSISRLHFNNYTDSHGLTETTTSKILK